MSLIERLEAAGKGSRELSDAVALAAGWSPVPNPTVAGGLVGRWYSPGGKMSDMFGAPRFTTSIDAAITLRPDGYDYGCGSQDCAAKSWAWVGKREAPNTIQWETMFSENAATPALALCIAALRARGVS